MTIQKTTQICYTAVNPARLDTIVRNLAPYARYQVTPEFREAAIFCRDALQREGFETEILSYPSQKGVRYQTAIPAPEWDCKAAWAELVNDGNRRIADYAANKNQVYEHSGAFSSEEPIELVLMDKGEDEAAYEGIDFRGKAVLLYHMHFSQVKWVFDKRGAVGFLACGKPEPGFEDIIYWAAIRDPEYFRLFAFQLSPNEGTRVRDFIKKRWADEGEPALVRIHADTNIGDGSFENVTALLRGETDEEILIVAHLCHPQNSCNDNLSGVAAGMEALRILKQLTERGALPPLKRSIRLLLVPEYLGSYAYVTQIGEERRRILAGLNLDMVGATQDDHNGPVTICEPPHAQRSFVTGLASVILRELKKDLSITSEYGTVPLWNALITEYRGGSDHGVWNDPLIGVPMPMVGQMPDKYYHSSGDKPETLDPFIHAKSTALAAAFAYSLANLSAEDIPVLQNEIAERLVNRIGDATNRALAGELDEEGFARTVRHYTEFYTGTADDYERFFSGDEAARVREGATAEKARLARLAALAARRAFGKEVSEPEPVCTEEKYQAVPKRNYLGQIYDIDDVVSEKEGGKERQDAYEKTAQAALWGSIEHQADYYIDGKRTIGEIVEAAVLECHGYGTHEALYEYIKLQEFLGLIEITGADETEGLS
ncbi:MAG: DUF4910 domain-containing protein [Clostridiales Family XIII bacterium]|jgi:hypothetical protein|nr:DUF4910 domain-containing protein [Clostridiales Family XIII bacterium]